MTGRRSAALLAGVALALAGCAGPEPPPRAPEPLPALPLEQIAQAPPAPTTSTPAPEDPLHSAGLRPVTFTARDADVRQVLAVLAEAAGVSLVLGPEVSGRVSVHFEAVPAREALEVLLERAGLAIAGERLAPPWGPVLFYPLPVNVDEASAALIQARFDVSAELAEWLVRARVP